MEKQKDTAGIKMGMWLFLYTEIMLFGGLFVVYATYYHRHTADFISGGRELALMFGAINTLILLASSFTVAASITAIRRGKRGHSMEFLLATIFFGLVFLVNKYFEWGHKFELDIYPGSSTLTDGEPGRNIFFTLYYAITGLHGIHIVIGLVLLSITVVYVHSQKIRADNYALLENAGLYWHLVDLIWIFIFPLFYLIL